MIEYQKRLYYENLLNDDDLCNLTIRMYPNVGHACMLIGHMFNQLSLNDVFLAYEICGQD